MAPARCLAPVLAFAFLSAASAAQDCWPQLQVFAPPDVVYSEQFGNAIAIDGHTAMVGAHRKGDLGAESGAVYVLTLQGSTWVQQAKLLPSNGMAHARFGSSVAIEGDRALIGAAGHAMVGNAYLFVRQGTNWVQEAELAPTGGPTLRTYGGSVAIFGDTLAVGAPAINGGTPGAVRVFVRSGGAWVIEADLIDPTPGPTTWPREFGHSLALGQDLLVVGARQAHVQQNFSGAILVYRRSAGTWSLEQTLIPASLGYKSYLGTSLALDGERIAAGAPGQLNDPDPGSVYVFEHQAGSWVETARVRAQSATGLDQFGASVALEGDRLLVGAPRTSLPNPFSGVAYAFGLLGDAWRELTPMPSGLSDSFQYAGAVAIGGEVALLGHQSGGPTLGGTVHSRRFPARAGTALCFCPVGPCANPDPLAGCGHGAGQGASLMAVGRTSPDSLTLLVRGAPSRAILMPVQADSNAAPTPFGNGRSCAGIGLRKLLPLPRLAGPDGTAVFGACAGDAPISLLGGVVPGSGKARYYEVWFRDPAGPCGASFNTSNGIELLW